MEVVIYVYSLVSQYSSFLFLGSRLLKASTACWDTPQVSVYGQLDRAESIKLSELTCTFFSCLHKHLVGPGDPLLTYLNLLTT